MEMRSHRRNVILTLSHFGCISGLKINEAKTKLISIGNKKKCNKKLQA
jgi:hypothetical protein